MQPRPLTTPADLPPRGNALAPRRALVGRDAELAALAAAFDGEGARLVTVCGPAGIGKTQLALHFAWAARRGYPGGAWVCDLSDAESTEALCARVAALFDVPLPAAGNDGSATAAVERLARALAGRGRTLLVLDNFEQLVEPGGAAAVAAWLERAGRLELVVTSRERLRLADERCVLLPPLALPAPDAREPDAVARAAAVALFLERARAVRAGFALSAADAPDVAAVVRAVEGVPLAIELCAARMGILSPAQLARQLADPRADPLAALGAGPRDGAARHASLERAIAWSWRLLAPWEQDALAQCAVFHGGFDLEALAAVLEPAAGAPAGPGWPIEALQALHDKSLVHAYETAAAPGERRFALLASVRAFAARELARSGRAPGALARHAAYYLALGAELGAPGAAARDRLRLEAPNLFAVYHRGVGDDAAALDTAATARSPDRARAAAEATRALCALGPLVTRGELVALATFTAQLDRALARLDATSAAAADDARGSAGVDPALRAEALVLRGRLEITRGDLGEALRRLELAAAAARDAGAAALEAQALVKTGLLRGARGESDAAHACFERARACARAAGEPPWLAALIEMDLASVLSREAREVEALERLRRAVDLFAAAGDLARQGFALGYLAFGLHELGHADEARACGERALALTRAAGAPRRDEATVSGYLACALLADGRAAEAEAQMRRSLALYREVGDLWSEAWCVSTLGAVALEQGDADAAAERFGQAAARFEQLRDGCQHACLRAQCGAADALAGRVESARAHLEASSAIAAASPERVLGSLVTLLRGYVAFAQAVRARGEGALARARELSEEARGWLRAARAPGEGAAATGWACSERVRLLGRVLERELGELDASRAVEDDAPARGDRDADDGAAREPRVVLEVGPDARWFGRTGEPRVELLKRRAVRLILLALVEQRIARPGRALTLAELAAAGWPGERILPDAANNRVYVALSRLRKMGLRDWLQSRDDGFLLDPRVPVRRGAEPAG